MALRTGFLSTLLALSLCGDAAWAGSNIEVRFPSPLTVALLPSDASREQTTADSYVPRGALERAATWIVRRGLERYNTSTEIDLFVDAADGHLDEYPLIEAALIAEGLVDRAERDACIATFNAAFAELLTTLGDTNSEEQRAGVLLDSLHRKLFAGGYRVDCTRLSEVLAEEQYNCVSATILFCAYAEQLGLDTVAIEVPGHVLCTLAVADQRIDIETTCARWLSIPNREELRSRFIYNTEAASDTQRQAIEALGIDPATSSVQLEPGTVAWRQELPLAALVAIVYYNRGLDELAECHYEAAAVANVNALRINPRSPAAWSNLLATINNWALAANRQGDFHQATTLLREGIQLAPHHELFRANLETVNRQWANAKRTSPHG